MFYAKLYVWVIKGQRKNKWMLLSLLDWERICVFLFDAEELDETKIGEISHNVRTRSHFTNVTVQYKGTVFWA